MSKLHIRLSKFILAAAMTILPACCMHGNVVHPAEKQTMAEHLEDMTVALVEVSKDDSNLLPTTNLRPYCAGVWISHDEILTAAHCTADLGKSDDRLMAEQLFGAEGMPAWDPTGQEANFSVHEDLLPENELQKYYSGVVEVFDEGDDLSLIKVPDAPKHAIAKLSEEEIRDGDDVHVVGHPRGVMWTYVRGYVSSTRNVSNPHDYTFETVQVSAPVWFGNSGGGAYDADGNLIGISSFIAAKVPNMSFFVHRDVIRAMLVHNHVHGY